MSKFLIDRYSSLDPYVPGEQPQDRKYIKLNTNESPYPPSPKAVAAIDEDAVRGLRLYSDPECRVVSEAIAEYYGVKRSEVIVGNGSDEILAFIYAAFCDGKHKLASPSVSYGFYPVFGALVGVENYVIPLKNDYSLDVEAFVSCPDNVIFANPNAQTGIAITLEDVERIVSASSDRLVVVDEAYVDFGAESAVELTRKYGNLIVVQTFSKSRSLAGARLGFAIANEALIADLKAVKFSFNPYNVNRLTEKLGAEAIRDKEWFDVNRRKIIVTREYARAALKELGFEVLPSVANFLLARSDEIAGEALYLALKTRGVLVRHFSDPALKDFVRITVGSGYEMEILVKEIKNIITGA